MSEEKRYGRQLPTSCVVLPYQNTHGNEAVELYESSGGSLIPWQSNAMYDILAYGDDGLFIHSIAGYEIPRRNGKGEVLCCRELWGLENGQNGLHTAHVAKTSSDASKRLEKLLRGRGYTECLRPKLGQDYPNQYSYAKQSGQEEITLLWGSRPKVSFRTRTGSGALGEGYDYVIIDEAQEYTEAHATALAFVTSASRNPQTIYCGTPPTVVSKGTVFPEYRTKCLTGESYNALWFEWSVEEWTDPNDIDAWYECNPSLGYHLTERVIKEELLKTTPDDFNIQRLGLWITYNQKSEITEALWNESLVHKLPALKGPMHVGIKFGRDGVNVSVAIAVKTEDGRVYAEVIDCKPLTAGYSWIISFLLQSEWQSVAIDGTNGQTLKKEMADARIRKPPILPTVGQICQANSQFRQALGDEGKATFAHSAQPSVDAVATKCERRIIGNGGFGFKALESSGEIALLDSEILAFWLAFNAHEKRKKTCGC